LRIAVNASARHVNRPAIVTDVREALAVSGLDAARLEIELTETALTNRFAAQHLAELRRLGVAVAIDDFGTGYTSIGRLADLPVDVLKIDRSFVGSADPRRQALVALMVRAGQASDLAVVAEGVEDQATLDAVRDLGCDRAQGYHLARPMPAADVPGWLAAQGWAEPAEPGDHARQGDPAQRR
jgi:EAL domain-containing protein (putative c-di-GMP-specific phosphodiesterase class I)